jgi:acylphosphatase
MTGRHVIFKGRVQGVGFRYTACKIAQRFMLTGFVRNLPDGSVEMQIQGSDDSVEACTQEIEAYFSDYIRNTEQTELPYEPTFTDFKIAF